MTATPPKYPADVAVIFSDQGFGAPASDRMRSARRIDSDIMHSRVGLLGGEPTVCAWPVEPKVDLRKLIPAIVAAHRPKLFIAAGDAKPLSGDQTCVSWACRSVDSSGVAMRLTAPNAVRERLPQIELVCSESEQNQGAVAPWAHGVVADCAALGLPLTLLVLLVRDHAASDDPELKSYYQQHTIAGRLGAVVGALWRRPTFAKEAFGRVKQGFQSREQLAEAVEGVISSVSNESGLTSQEATD